MLATGTPYKRGRLSTVDLLVLTCLDQLLFICIQRFYFVRFFHNAKIINYFTNKEFLIRTCSN